MLKKPDIYRTRVFNFLVDVVVNAIYEAEAPVSISSFQCADPILYEEAVKQEFKPVSLGFRFGPKWSTAWFKVEGKVPDEFAGQKVVLRFKSETEALVYRDGVPAQGMERNHDDYVLFHSARGGEEFTLFIECGVNLLAGANGGSRYDSREPRSGPDQPGNLHTCAIAVANENVRALYWDMAFLSNLEDHLPDTNPRSGQVLRALNDAVNVLDPNDVAGTASAAREILVRALSVETAGSATTVHAVGHAHIDLAWLWPVRETVRKGSRTYSTQVALMDEYPEYVFQGSNAQLYSWVKDRYPGLFDRIREKVKRGQWEAGGAMWVEADCNISSGESLVRQILHGTNFWKEEFGVDQSYLWLPDVFGYSAAMPQILKLAGLQYFVTQKISWNEFNRFPHNTFMWEGIDGTEILTHFLPTDTYNGNNKPEELIHGQVGHKDSDRSPLWLQAFGYGDGGGGPTREHIEYVKRAANCDGLPRAQFSRVDDFLVELERQSVDLERWVGELYLEFHRGTYTNQAHNKLYNRLGEFCLREAELLSALAPTGSYAYPAKELDATWKLFLLQQFHDIIPGSSITWVYEDSHDDYEHILATARAIIADARKAWLGAIDTSPVKNPVVVFNSLSHEVDGIISIPESALPSDFKPRSLRDRKGKMVSAVQKVESNGSVVYLARATQVAPLGFTVFGLDTTPASPAVRPYSARASFQQGRSVLENQHLRAEFDRAGRLVRLIDKRAHREVVDAEKPANQFVLYEDRPNTYDAWNVDAFYTEKSSAIVDECEIRLVEDGPVRAVIETQRPIGLKSKMIQRIILGGESRRIDFETFVDWQEDHTFLRVLNPVNVHSARATYEIQYGHVERPTHFNTSWDTARFEVVAQKWADYSEPGYGVALLNNGKYGHSVHGHVMGLSLLRSSTSPDPTSDRGEHRFTYSIMPHAGDFPKAGVIAEGYKLNQPLTAVVESQHKGALGPSYSPVTVDADNVVIEVVKQAENSRDVIVRLYESHGQRNAATLTVNFPFTSCQAVDLLERPTDLYAVAPDGNKIRLDLTPFAIRTIAFRL